MRPWRRSPLPSKHVAGLSSALQAGTLGDLSEDLADAVLTEAGRFASEEVAPLHKVGDEVGARLEKAVVTMPPGWKDLYHRWVEGGWNGLSAPESHGGQALPMMAGRRRARDVELRLHGLRHRPHPDHGCDRGDREARFRRVEGHLSRQARLGRVDGHDEF